MVLSLQGHGKIKFICALAVLSVLGYVSVPSSLFETHASPSPPLLRTSMKLSAPDQDDTQRHTSQNNSNDPSHGLSFILSAPASSCCTSSSSCEASPSILLSGRLLHTQNEAEEPHFDVHFSDKEEVYSYLHATGKNLYLSELVAFCGHIYVSDRNSGILYEVSTLSKPSSLTPRQVLTSDGSSTPTAMAVEWAAVKSGMLFLGGNGAADNSQWIATVDPSGRTRYLNWDHEYSALQSAAWLNTHYQTLVHEAMIWSDVLNMWIVLPQVEERLESVPEFRSGGDHPHIEHSRVSKHSIELHNYQILIADSEFLNVQRVRLESVAVSLPWNVSHDVAELRAGFTSLKFLPHSQDKILVALLTVEHPKKCSDMSIAASFVVVLSLSGEILSSPVPIPAPHSFRGLEFL